MATQCFDMVGGNLLHYPHEGGAMDQHPDLMNLIKQARRAWVVWGYKPANKIKWTAEDRDFMTWVDNG